MTVQEEEEEDKEEPGVRRPCTLQPVTIARLKRMARTRLWGGSIPKVMTSLIEEGIRRAISEKLLAPDDDMQT